jgi:hypothetical protein
MGSTQYDERVLWKHVLEHLPPITAQPDVDTRFDPAASYDRSEAPLQACGSDKAFL